MRLICPHCMSGVTVPDDTAGKEAVCPNCAKSFPTPPRYAASVVPDASKPVAGSIEPVRTSPQPEPPPIPSQPPTPPGYVPLPSSSSSSQLEITPSGFLSPSTASLEIPGGYTKSRGITFNPHVVAWLPSVFLTLALLLTFFPWVGSYLGGHAIYSQGPWSAMVRATNPNRGLEAFAPPGMVGWTDKVRSDWLLMAPFLLLLILATLLALADRGMKTFDPRKIPPLANVWPHRHTIIAGLSVAALAIVVIQSLAGFGLERAARQVVRTDPSLTAEREKAKAGDARAAATVENKEEQELAKFNLDRTIWMHLAVTCMVLATLSAIGVILLERRGNKPPPKLLLHY